MRISSIFVLIVLASTLGLGCATSSGHSQEGSAGASPAITSAGAAQTEQQASPYSQPLMATGGDLVMLRIATTRVIAG